MNHLTPKAMTSSPHQPIHQSSLMRALFFVLGLVCLILGLIGVVVPGMPTTVFILLCAYFWAKSSRRFYAWLLAHRIFGPMIVDWQTRRAMPRFAKYLAWLMMTVSTVALFLQLSSQWLWVAWLVAIFCLAVGVWMARLPDA
ncbi:YbaN family protein [Moraxella canis]|uniref:YbaN family protein n=1 Tax=Moraxella canis TaxID=90239 RepID=UPI00066698F5|nr:YbaN family protein [Moraxella canis]